MAISFVSAVAANGNVVTLPAAVTAGDLVVLLAVRHNSTTPPGTPTGATLIQSKAASSGSLAMSQLKFTAGGATSISSANATHLGCSIYRNQTATSAIGGFTSSASNALSLSVAVILSDFTMAVGDGTSFVVAGYFHTRTSGLSAVTGMTERFDIGSASVRCALSDAAFADFTVRTAAASAARDWGSVCIEIKASETAVAAGQGANMFTRSMTGCGLKVIVEEMVPPFWPLPIAES